MEKKLEDIIAPSSERRRSIRDIPIPEGRKRNDNRYGRINNFSEKIDEGGSRDDLRSDENPLAFQNVKLPKSPRKTLWFSVAVAALILIFSLLSVFKGAKVTYTPKEAKVSLNNEIFTAEKNGGDESLLFSIIKYSADKGVEIPSSGEEKVDRKATGTIIVYNRSNQPQRLIENTRFETPDGLIFRIPKAIVVPAGKKVANEIIPGSVETVVYADQVGDKYNIGLVDFTVPGLAGTPRFSDIYARSKTEMSGGFSGIEKILSEADKTKARAQIESLLREELLSSAQTQVPNDFVLIPSLSFISFRELPQSSAANKNNVMFNMRGDFFAVIFKKGDLSTKLMKSKLMLLPGETIEIVNLDSLNFTFTNTPPEALSTATSSIQFSVNGEAAVVWRIDEVALKSDLAGKRKKDLPLILRNYPAIVSASATIRPFWKTTFPDSPSEIILKKTSR